MLQFSYPEISTAMSLHNHSTWSDGWDDMEVMVRSAKQSGLRYFGLSDHYVAAPDDGYGAREWSMELSRLPQYVEAMEQLKQRYNDESFTLYCGLEIDYFAETFPEVKATIEQYPLDYRIGSTHYAGRFPVDHTIENWIPLGQDEVDEIWRIYWQGLQTVAESGWFTFLAHLDLPKKFGFYTTQDYMTQARSVLDAVAKTGTALEINTSGWFKPCKEAYPSRELIREALARHIPFVISADAHRAQHITRAFEQASDLLTLCAAPEIC